jgi:hypothetical protein
MLAALMIGHNLSKFHRWFSGLVLRSRGGAKTRGCSHARHAAFAMAKANDIAPPVNEVRRSLATVAG